jgi:hypothetical protein
MEQPRQDYHHHHHAFDDVLNTELVDATDAAIARAEAQPQADYDSQGFPSPGGLSKSDTLSEDPLLESGLGARLRCHAKILRKREFSKVTNVELFFDLVFVFASKS